MTVVGGTNLTVNGGVYQGETAWAQSGGGVLDLTPIPPYQWSVSMAANEGSTTHRNIPDVAAVACTTQGLYYYDRDSGVDTGGCGTSVSAPVWASFVALANQESAKLGYPSLGYINPLLYQIAQSSRYLSLFNDIATGSNGAPGYDAVNGYDLVTGWGTPKCALLNVLAPPPAAALVTVAATETQTGPTICMFGTGFTPEGEVRISYSGIPGRTAPIAGSGGPVLHDGWFGLTDTTEDLGSIDRLKCTAAQLAASVTVVATDGSHVATATLPAALWCPNGDVTSAGGGCGGCGPAGCGACPANEKTCGGTCCAPGESCAQSSPTPTCCPANETACGSGAAATCCPSGACVNGACCLGPIANGECCAGGFAAKVCGGQCCTGECTSNGGCCATGSGAVVCGAACCASVDVCLNSATSSCGTPTSATLFLGDPSTGQVLGQSGGPPVRISNQQEITVKGQAYDPGLVTLSVDKVGGVVLGTAQATGSNGGAAFSVLVTTGAFGPGAHSFVGWQTVGGTTLQASVPVTVEVIQ